MFKRVSIALNISKHFEIVANMFLELFADQRSIILSISLEVFVSFSKYYPVFVSSSSEVIYKVDFIVSKTSNISSIIE